MIQIQFHFEEILRQGVDPTFVMSVRQHDPSVIRTCYYKLLQTVLLESLALPTHFDTLSGEKSAPSCGLCPFFGCQPSVY